jgi:hypothetical protein
MKYLDQKFAQLNVKLDKIIDLQVQTLLAVKDLQDQQKKLGEALSTKLDEIENTILQDEPLLQTIVLDKWEDCKSIFNQPALNGTYAIGGRDMLIEILSFPDIGRLLHDCHDKALMELLTNHVKPGDWAGQIISDANFPSTIVPGDVAIRRIWRLFQFQKANAFRTASDFLAAALHEADNKPARYLAIVAQPVSNIRSEKVKLDKFGEEKVSERFDDFRCNQYDVLSDSLRDLLCYGIQDGSAERPTNGRWHALLNTALIGPLAMTVLDAGMTVAQLINFGVRDPALGYDMVTPEEVRSLPTKGMTRRMRNAVEERGAKDRESVELLKSLSWLAEAMVFQQSVTYGNYTAELIEEVLYDRNTRALAINDDVDPLRRQARLAMEANPVLARNVVTLALRHTMADTSGGPDAADAIGYERSNYSSALSEFTVPASCQSEQEGGYETQVANRHLKELFANWTFEYVVSPEAQNGASFRGCPAEFIPNPDSQAPLPRRGGGVAVKLWSDFYVLAPSPMVLSSGTYESNDGLRIALSYRDKVSQTLIDQQLGETVNRLMSQEGAVAATGAVALGIFNEGWGWQGREKSTH